MLKGREQNRETGCHSLEEFRIVGRVKNHKPSFVEITPHSPSPAYLLLTLMAKSLGHVPHRMSQVIPDFTYGPLFSLSLFTPLPIFYQNHYPTQEGRRKETASILIALSND